MGKSDLGLRKRAIPFRANWYDSTLKSSGSTNLTGDIASIISQVATANGTNALRFCRPEKGDLTEARLLFDATAPTGGTSTLRIFGCDFSSDNITANTSALTEVRKASDWFKITNNSSPLSYSSGSQILLDGLNLLPIIPRRGDSNFISDGFIIVFELVLAGTPATDWYLNNFKLDCSVQLAAV